MGILVIAGIGSPGHSALGTASEIDQLGAVVATATTAGELADSPRVTVPELVSDPLIVRGGAGEIRLGLPMVDSSGERTGPGTTVYPSVGPVDVAVQSMRDGSARALIVVSDDTAPTEYRFPVTLPQGGRLLDPAESIAGPHANAGTVVALDAGGNIFAAFAPPWAKDAHGAAIPTSYRIEGETLIQTVAHGPNTAYPVVADPHVEVIDWFPPNFVITLYPTDQNMLLGVGGAGLATAISAMFCSLGTFVASTICSVISSMVVTAATETIKSHGVQEGCDVNIRYNMASWIGVEEVWRIGTCL